LLVRGAEETAIIDPSLAVIPRQREFTGTDRVINSHCHEDHIAGNHCFPDASWHLHEADRVGMRSLDDFMAIYGYPEPIEAHWRVAVVERFHFVARADALAFADGDVFDLGGVRIRVIHTPGHTRGHCAFHIEPEDVLYLGDIDLSGFGPYYGDAWSDLEEFERTLDRIGGVRARHYATFHHIGVLEREAFLERLARFRDVIRERERRLLEYLEEPRSLDDIVRHRFVYRPTDQVSFADGVELRSMSQHLERLVNSGRARQLEPGRWRAVAG
jgi:glyoxylase-like metal-dependent hydrolase (beta-lactamase superfamily II)